MPEQRAHIVKVTAQVEVELTHALPAPGGFTACCDHTMWELKASDRVTTDMAEVTCPGAWLKRKEQNA